MAHEIKSAGDGVASSGAARTGTHQVTATAGGPLARLHPTRALLPSWRSKMLCNFLSDSGSVSNGAPLRSAPGLRSIRLT